MTKKRINEVVSAYKRILKGATMPSITKAWSEADGIYTTDGYRIATTKVPINDLIPMTDHAPLNVHAMLEQHHSSKVDTIIQLPTIQETKEAIKRLKAESKLSENSNRSAITYTFENGDTLMTVNAKYLLDGLLITNGNYAQVESNTGRKPMFIDTAEGSYVLLPINCTTTEKGFHLL